MKTNEKLLAGWNRRLAIRAEGDRLYAKYKNLCAERARLCARGDRLHAEGCKLYAEGKKLCAEVERLHAEGKKIHAEGEMLYGEKEKLYAEGTKLYAEGDILWANLILETYGNNIEMEWVWNEEHGDRECHLENGEVYGFEGKGRSC